MKNHFNWLRWLLVPAVLLTLVFGAAGKAQAVEIDNDGIVAAGEVINDDVLLLAVSPVWMGPSTAISSPPATV